MATDWTHSIQDLTAKAAEAYTRYASEAQDLLAKVYRGEVAPLPLQEHIPQFLRDRGTRFYGEFSQLSFEFFAGLLKLSATYSDQYFRGLIPDEAEPAPASEPSGPGDWTRWYQILNTYVAEHNNRTVQKYHRLLERISKGEISSADVQSHTARFTQEHGPRYAEEAAQLSFRFFDGLVRLNQRYNDELFQTLSNGDRASPDAPAEPVYLDLSGPVGSQAAASLVIENNRFDRAEISCHVSEFRNTDGTGPAFSAPVEIEPARFSLRPEETQRVHVGLPLRADLFTPGQSYAATMIVRGQGEQDILVFLVVKPTPCSAWAP